MFNNKKFMIDTNEDNEIIQINDDFQELNEESEENDYIQNNSQLYNDDEEDYSNYSNSNRLKNILKNSIKEIDTDVDPNFRDKKLKKEEEKRRQKEVEEFEKRISPQNQNIIDFDEINKREEEDNEVDEEGIFIDNTIYLSVPKKNSFPDKIEEKQNLNNMYINMNNKSKIKNRNYNENDSEDVDSKITQMKNNHINSYEKDDITSNNLRNKEKIEEIKILVSKESDRYNDTNKDYFNEIKENNINNDNNISKEYNMNFYDTSRKNINENNKNFTDIFENLLPNKTFKKFLKTKIKYYVNDKDIPKDFIKNLNIEEDINNNQNNTNINRINIKTQILNQNQNYKKHIKKENNKTIDYSNFYDQENTIYLNNNKNKNNLYNKSMKNFYNNNNIGYNNDDINNYISNYDKVYIENKLNKEKIEDLKRELNNQKNAMNEKLNKINKLENINDNLKNEMNKLQQNFEYERINNNETKKNYVSIKNNYTDIKNQFDLLNMKYITLRDENYNYRRDKDLYEKQIKTKNEMIENLLENNSTYKKNNINNKLNKINSATKYSNEIISDYIKIKNNENIDKKDKNNNNNNINIENKEKENNENDKKVIDYNKFDKLSFPELQCKRDELKKERNDTNNIYCKIPLKSTSKELIIKRNTLEKKIEEINCDLMVVNLRIKNYKSHK